MSTQTEAMKLALEALEDAWLDASMGRGAVARHSKAITALREALAEQPAQEPFGYFKAEPFGWTDCAETDEGAIALYTNTQAQPAQRKPLTLQELIAAWNAQADHMNQWNTLGLDEMVAWAQAAHNIKGNT